MGAMGGEELMDWEKMQGVGNGTEEKILVLVRLRPLSEKEIARNDVADWECINSTTILYRNSLQERSGLPTAYSFDRVFRGDCKTREVYDEEIKDIALSVVGGINSTIFAYGQTSSGKTYTMNGITEYTVADIYDYIQKHDERAFVLKFSAMEIYNEVVRDLLSSDNNQLRLLDDPEKGMIIEKLTEETLRDWNHLKELLSICEAQRQIGETSLNEKSSRSHQILRLTIESSAREFIGKGNSTTLAASVNFVDLAGSERASQALSVGQRLKEGCHINRSLLTLGTVIRKLSKGRHGHVNYRDSKLTRILQPALGGNARTAIICTLNPSRSHVEQSRNTLLFASCAKEVSTNAKVNVVMSDKALVKHLQKEVARLESELKAPGSTCDHGPLLRKKDMQIEKLEKEIRELKKQRDLAHSRIADLLRAIESDKSSVKVNRVQSVNGEVKSNESLDLLRSQNSPVCYSSDDASDPSQITEEPLLATEEDSDEVSTDIRCIEVDESAKDGTYTSSLHSTSDSEGSMPLSSEHGNRHIVEQQLSPGLSTPLSGTDNSYSYVALEQNIQGVQKTIDSLFKPHSDESSPSASSSMTASGGLLLTRSRSCRANLITVSPDMGSDEQNESTPPTMLEKDFVGRPEGGFQRKQWKLPPVIYGTNSARLTGNDSQSTDYNCFIDETKNHNAGDGDEDIPTLGSFVAGLREMAKLQYGNQTPNQVQCRDATAEKNARDVALDPMNNWPIKFEMLQKSIFELWQACNVSLVHRTYFIFLIKEDSTDSIYMEVEHRRLSFLKETFSRGNFAVQDGRTLTLASSKKALRREREMLSKRMSKAFTEDERNRIYEEWGIDINSKRRRMRLVQLLWRDTEDMNHIRKSGEVVAKLIGFSMHGQAMKEMLGLSFMPPQRMMGRRSLRWKNSMATLL
ncbi:kinesin-like protein KIN-7C [Salvia miltiorrhiza]|uniref:kinesin-like protein KIN-7C n=1 Tax=Salvia miltiorrhiza TaxID=226208 RepID=UPI0025ABC85C|nr:kinesin-like protein KIN-7C [Salvia miltiorrhiza]XP_057783141.1 kinesin-like protein KIN-7C [Salvia miltiorrhiza]XP_057783142.1 kinesin-like protein KIN-7C [Salvia miltiorrhiza]XP_057783143.1 kinesin-like protein KIN-7C [Salvia miltiorrhiza]